MPLRSTKVFAIKAEVQDPLAEKFVFMAQPTMYGGKQIREGDTIFLFASETQGGHGLFARGIVTSAESLAKRPDVERQAPRVSITVKPTALAKAPLGRVEVKSFKNWQDGQPQTEINFKFYRQATNKIVGITAETTAFLNRLF